MTIKDKITHVYLAKSGEFILTKKEEKIIRAMERLNKLWKDYKKSPQENRLILFCG